MIRAKLWFKCVAIYDLVSPTIVQPCLVRWDAKKRKIDLVITRSFNGEELALKMRGGGYCRPRKIVEVIKKFGKLTVINERELVVETDTIVGYKN